MWEREEKTEEGSAELQARQTAYSQHIMAIIRQRREVDWEGLEGETQKGGGSQEVGGWGGVVPLPPSWRMRTNVRWLHGYM